MIPVREESDSLGWIGDGEKSQRTLFALGDLDQSNKDANDSDGEDNEAQQTPLAIGEQDAC